MSVFLRWGVFGILAVAAMLYAYNASKRLAENRGVTPSPAAVPSGEVLIPVPEYCQLELRVAERALEARRNQEPLDKLFRVRLIAFEDDPARRARLEKVAADWYLLEGEEPSEAALRREVVADCESVTPGP